VKIFNWKNAYGHDTLDWRESLNGTHVPLPLDASAVPDAVVVRVRDAFSSHIGSTTLAGAVLQNADVDLAMRAAIAALAQALGEVG